MKPLAKVASPAALAVLRQATAIAPLRKKASDGLLPSIAHFRQNPNSDHNTGLAVDLTHDPKHGIDCKEIYKNLQRDNRVDYLIFKGKIWSKRRGERKYTGKNPHDKHLHISVKPEHASNTRPWFPWMNEAKLAGRVVAELSTPRRKKPAKVEAKPARKTKKKGK